MRQDRWHQVLEGTAVGRGADSSHPPAGPGPMGLSHDLRGVLAAAVQRVACELLAVGLVHQAAEGVLHVLERLASE